MIPKILHLYWGRNQPLSYLRYMTARSFQLMNPDWDIRVWVPVTTSDSCPWDTGEQGGYSGEDHLPFLRELIYPVDFDRFGLPSDLPEVHKADLFRWYLLGSFGGVWSDFDILYIKPISDQLLEQWKGAGLCKYKAIPKNPLDYLAIGFHTSEGNQGKDFFYGLYEMGKAKIPQTGYQAFGAELLKEYLIKRGEKDVFYLPPELVYPYFTYMTIIRYWRKDPNSFEKSIGCHWYAGMPHSSRFENMLDGHNVSRYAKHYSLCREIMKIAGLEVADEV